MAEQNALAQLERLRAAIEPEGGPCIEVTPASTMHYLGLNMDRPETWPVARLDITLGRKEYAKMRDRIGGGDVLCRVVIHKEAENG